MGANILPSLDKYASAKLAHVLSPVPFGQVGKDVRHQRHVAVDLAGGRNRPRQHQREDQRSSHVRRGASRPALPTPLAPTKRVAPNVRGIIMMTAGTTSTSARNATIIVSASRPPNHAVGL